LRVRPTQNFGVDLSQIRAGKECSVNGRGTSKSRGIEALEKNTPLADDTAKLHLTIYGDGREGVVQDLERSPALAEFKGKFLVQSYPANSWAVDPKLNYPTPNAGKPVILIQTTDGKVVHSQKDYNSGSTGLARALAESLRRPVPHTDPDRFPDLRNSLSVNSIIEWLKSRSPLGVAWWVVLATIAVVYYLNHKKAVPAVVVNTAESK
jgi:hypothetical protein